MSDKWCNFSGCVNEGLYPRWYWGSHYNSICIVEYSPSIRQVWGVRCIGESVRAPSNTYDIDWPEWLQDGRWGIEMKTYYMFKHYCYSMQTNVYLWQVLNRFCIPILSKYFLTLYFTPLVVELLMLLDISTTLM